MKYDITVKKDKLTETISVSSIRELHSTLSEYREAGYHIKDVSNAFGRTRGILSLNIG